MIDKADLDWGLAHIRAVLESGSAVAIEYGTRVAETAVSL
jgi:hypothetical protein